MGHLIVSANLAIYLAITRPEAVEVSMRLYYSICVDYHVCLCVHIIIIRDLREEWKQLRNKTFVK